MEMLMVADKTMYEFYKGGLEEYLLTIANMVSFHCFGMETRFLARPTHFTHLLLLL